MKKLILIIIIIAFLSCSVVFCLFSNNFNKVHSLIITPKILNIEEIKPDEYYEFEFNIYNDSIKVVKLIYIGGECDCTFEMPSKGVVPAKGVFILRVKFNSSEHKNISELNEKITILTDHPKKKIIEVFIRTKNWQNIDIGSQGNGICQN